MKGIIGVLAFMVATSLCSMVQAFGGPPLHESLHQLPAYKEMLFHQTMREVWDATTNIREQIKRMEAETEDLLTAPEFNEASFLEKTRSLQDLHRMVREAMDEAIAKLAGQFTTEERSILAELICHKPTPERPPPGR